jgi:hypothetical protein
LLAQAAHEDIKAFVIWRSRKRYSEDDGRSKLVLEVLVERTGGRAAQFRDTKRIPSIVAQFIAALRAAYELRLRVPTGSGERRIDIEVSLPKEGPRVQVSCRKRARVEPE